MACYLVTGGCGFIGSHLAEALTRRGDQVKVVDDLSTGVIGNLPPGAALLRGDVADPVLMGEAVQGIAGCFHLAAVASVQRSLTDLLGSHRTNLGGLLTVLNAITGQGGGIPVVYASSAAVYGDGGSDILGEEAPTRPRSAYGADKRACELHAAVASHVHGIPTTGLRFFNVYGPRQPWDSPYSGVVSIFARRIGRGEPITVYGDGQQTRDLVAVHDVVAALLRAMEARLAGSPVFNICTGTGTSVLQLARLLGALQGRTPEIRFEPIRPGEIRQSVGDPAYGRAKLALASPVTLRTGLASLLEAAVLD